MILGITGTCASYGFGYNKTMKNKTKKKVHPAVSEYYRKLGKKGGKKSAEAREKTIIEKVASKIKQ